MGSYPCTAVAVPRDRIKAMSDKVSHENNTSEHVHFVHFTVPANVFQAIFAQSVGTLCMDVLMSDQYEDKHLEYRTTRETDIADTKCKQQAFGCPQWVCKPTKPRSKSLFRLRVPISDPGISRAYQTFVIF